MADKSSAFFEKGALNFHPPGMEADSRVFPHNAIRLLAAIKNTLIYQPVDLCCFSAT